MNSVSLFLMLVMYFSMLCIALHYRNNEGQVTFSMEPIMRQLRRDIYKDWIWGKPDRLRISVEGDELNKITNVPFLHELESTIKYV